MVFAFLQLKKGLNRKVRKGEMTDFVVHCFGLDGGSQTISEIRPELCDEFLLPITDGFQRAVEKP